MNQVSAPANGRRSAAYPPDDAAASRHDELTAAAARVKVRRSSVPVEMILLIAACVLFPAGIVLILVGWDGAAHTGHLYEQVDYLISGGLLGVALAAAGGFMYFGYWLSRQLNESRRQTSSSCSTSGTWSRRWPGRRPMRRRWSCRRRTRGRRPMVNPAGAVGEVVVAVGPPPQTLATRPVRSRCRCWWRRRGFSAASPRLPGRGRDGRGEVSAGGHRRLRLLHDVRRGQHRPSARGATKEDR